MPPRMTCSRISAVTTQKYLAVAFIDGVARSDLSGSLVGSAGGASLPWLTAWYQTSAPMPASITKMLTNVHMKVGAVGAFATSGSEGQLLVYVTVSLGRFVTVDHEVQKKNAVSA